MAIGRIKKKDHEKLDGPNIEKVIVLREQPKPISIKAACELLNIANNGARLQKIIDEYKQEKINEEKHRATNRGKPASSFEIQTVINNYLDGVSVVDIAKRLYRSSGFVNRLVEEVGIPQRVTGHNYFAPPLVPDKCVSNSFEVGQLVWDVRWNGMAIVISEAKSKQDYKVYQVYQLEAIDEPSPYFPRVDDYMGRYANTAAFDLCNLEHLKDYGIDIYKPYRASFSKLLCGR